MAILTILKEPHPILREKSVHVDVIDDTIRALLNDFIETMHDGGGIGLASPQVGILKRIFVMAIPTKDGFYERKIINPEITWKSAQKSECQESSLSMGEVFEKIKRPAEIKIKYQNENGDVVEEHLKGIESICFQHEFDHLDGILFIDHLSPFKRSMLAKKIRL